MPLMRFHTNIPKSRIPSDFLDKTVDLLATTLGKPKSYVAVAILPDQMMSWGGTTDPCATAELLCIGVLGRDENKKIADVLHRHVEQQLGIATDRMYIVFVPASKENVSFKGTTFDELM